MKIIIKKFIKIYVRIKYITVFPFLAIARFEILTQKIAAIIWKYIELF